MEVSRISSNVMSAQGAISKLTGLDASSIHNKHVEFAGSNISCMKAGQQLTNHMLKDVGELVECIQKQADKVEDSDSFFELLELLESSHLRKHESTSIAFEFPYSNGTLEEGMNTKIKRLKRASFGFRSFRNFKKKFMLMNYK